ncbi:MAG: 30S ribosomal protein S6e [Candidatus Micrarchaeota archaeon]|nr:30S ribosomal protein S6e [Candidatus Micrarchaeota archaeon]
MKIVFSDKKTGKTAQVEVPKDIEASLMGKTLGQELDGSVIGLDGFKLMITGMSDNTGAPSRSEIEGTRKARPLLTSGPGLRKAGKGYRARRMVRGNTISADTAQINTVISTYGTKPLDEFFKAKEKKE